MKGTLHVPSSYPNVAGMSCADFNVSAQSEQQTTRPAGYTGIFFPQSVWQNSAHATGNIATGTCSYSIIVKPKSAFYVTAGGGVQEVKCDYLSAAFSPLQSASFTLTNGAVKVQDFSLAPNGLMCEQIN